LPEGNEIHRWAERHHAALPGKKLRVEFTPLRETLEPALQNWQTDLT
jgi:hypothetical protein